MIVQDLLILEKQITEWRERNFPEGPDPQAQFLGVIEEVGELSRAILKRRQRIRGTAREHELAEIDAIGDILIFLQGYCTNRGWSITEIFYKTAHLVMKRDWIKDPQRGGETTTPQDMERSGQDF
jgi:NTP pyrophosphatase (non-canonical NTP hydrolase)